MIYDIGSSFLSSHKFVGESFTEYQTAGSIIKIEKEITHLEIPV